MATLGSNIQNNRRGLLVDDYLHLLGAKDIYAVGDVS
jgi:NADH dehydrogenase FAD-containing subunit